MALAFEQREYSVPELDALANGMGPCSNTAVFAPASGLR
jgi:hypothetical protein